MFPARYFAPAYYAARYWAKLGAAAPVIVRVRLQGALALNNPAAAITFAVRPVAQVLPTNPSAEIV